MFPFFLCLCYFCPGYTIFGDYFVVIGDEMRVYVDETR